MYSDKEFKYVHSVTMSNNNCDGKQHYILGPQHRRPQATTKLLHVSRPHSSWIVLTTNTFIQTHQFVTSLAVYFQKIDKFSQIIPNPNPGSPWHWQILVIFHRALNKLHHKCKKMAVTRTQPMQRHSWSKTVQCFYSSFLSPSLHEHKTLLVLFSMQTQ